MDIVELLKCPNCDGELKLCENNIVCLCCDVHYPIIEGIPRIIADGNSVPTRRSFDLKWSTYESGIHPLWSNWINGNYSEISYEYPVSDKEYQSWVNFLLSSLKVEKSFFKDKILLDAGCGMGWVSYAVAKLGSYVISTDLADSSVTSSSKILNNLTQCKIIQADLTRLPFKEKSFDIVISLGVLHHTPHTKSTFLQLAKTVKPEGSLFVHLYEKVHLMKESLTEMMRKVIHIFPESVQYEICKKFLTVDFNSLASQPLKRKFFRLLNMMIMLAKTPEETFDAYSPRYNHRHTFDEVKRWFEEAGFGDVRDLSPYLSDSKGNMIHSGAIWATGRKI